ncbi:hypothetical protein N9C99_01015 [Gammaproteobacteria bacterium]|nr:hypothetical protein [Gammaproteobacteria bacterium]
MKRLSLYILTSTFILASCGGGGGGGGSAPVAPSNPAPIINLSLSSSSVVTGTEVTITWSSSNANSCTANGAWSGDKDTSGNESIVVIESGSLSFGLTCTGTSSSSKTVSLDVNPALNAYAYINGPTTFSGFYVFKQKDTAAMVKSIEVDIDINDQDSLYISQFRYLEDRYLAAFTNDNGSADGLGLRLGQDYNVDDSGVQNTYYIPQVSEVFHSSNQIILNTDNSINPYTYADNVSTIDDLEIFSADVILDFDPDYIPTYTADGGERLYSHDNIRMSVYALPKENEDSNDSTFIGTYRNNDNYAFLYLIDKREVDEYSNNLPNESDIFGKNLLMLEVYNSYQSQPNLELITENGFRTKSEFAQINNLSNTIAAHTLDGSRLADAIDVSTNETLGAGNSYAIKYLQPDETSNQRFFLKTSLRSDSIFSNDCLDSYNYYRRCDAINWQLYFFTPDKESLVGFKLGGYFDEPHQTNARILLDNDDS